MNQRFIYWILFAVVTSTAVSGRHINWGRLLQSDEYFREKVDDQKAITSKDLPKNGELFEGDMVMDEGIRQAVLGQTNDKRSGVVSSLTGHSRHWKNGVVPYTLNPNLLPEVREQILKGIAELKNFTCIRYIPRTFEEDFVDFQDGSGCSSSVGRQGGMQVIHLASGCKRIGTVIHEMMHTIGIIHEQSRPDRDEHVIVRFDHIKPKLFGNFRKYSYHVATNLDLPYNFNSVMHYSNFAFTKDEEQTLVSKSDNHLHFGQRQQLTELDIEQINRLYQCHNHMTAEEKNDILIPNMTENDIEERKRDALEDLFFRDW